jgi:hypothetical protein
LREQKKLRSWEERGEHCTTAFRETERYDTRI